MSYDDAIMTLGGSMWALSIFGGIIMGFYAFLSSLAALWDRSDIKKRWFPLLDIKAGAELLVKEYRRRGYRLLVFSPILFTMSFPLTALIEGRNGLAFLLWYLVQMLFLVLVCREMHILSKHEKELIKVGLIPEIQDC